MSTTPSKENRQSVRVMSRIMFNARSVSKEKFLQILQDFNNGISLYNRQELADVQVYIGAQSALSRIKERDDDLGSFLQHLDGKLNLLLKKSASNTTLLDNLVLQKVCIGGNGLAFWSSSKFSKKSLLEMHIILPPEHIFIDCFGTVVNCMEEKDSSGNLCYRTSVRFKLIMDSDNESLIQYNFRQQSLALKRRRVQLETE